MTSKIFILGVLLCTATAGSLQAQNKTLQFGLKGGAVSSDISGGPSNKSSRLGLQAGAILTQRISDTFSMQYEALYSQKGVVHTNIDPIFDVKSKYDLDYLEIPILAKFKVSEEWYVYGGGYAGLALSKKKKETMILPLLLEDTLSETTLSDDETNTLDYGVILGAQVRLIGKVALLDARYTLGLTDVFKNRDSKNSNLSIAVIFLFI